MKVMKANSNRTLCIIGFLLVVVLFFSGVPKSGSLQFKDHSVHGLAPTSYLDRKTKCFQCENQVARQSGVENAGAAQSSKCFTCGDNPLLWRDGVMQHKRPIIGV